jgi:hypothetical protein
VAYILEDSEAPLLFAGPEVLDLARQAAGGLPSPPKVIAMVSVSSARVVRNLSSLGREIV